MTSFTAHDYRARARHLAKLFRDSEQQEEAFKTFVRECIETHREDISWVAIQAAKVFEDEVPEGMRKFVWLGRDMFEPIMTLLSDELPTPLQFAGLADIRVDALLDNNRYYVDILIAMRELGRNASSALNRLTRLSEFAEAKKCALLWYAIGRCHRKLNSLPDAVVAYDIGSTLTRSWLDAEKRVCPCQEKCNNEQLAIEFGRGLAAALRKQFTSSMGEAVAPEDVYKAFESVRNLYERLNNEASSNELNRAGADLFFSIGYFLYEQFFEMTFGTKCWSRSRRCLNRDPNEIRDEALASYRKSWEISGHRDTGALYGLATLHLYVEDYAGALKKFKQVLVEDGKGRSPDALNVEHALAGICIRMAITHLEQIGVKSGNSERVSDIQCRLAAVIERGIAQGPADCHGFNLLVLESIFKSHGKPFSPELMRTADILFEKAEKSVREAARSLRGTNGDSDTPTPDATTSKRFAVALSYPGERRDFIEEVALKLEVVFDRSRIFYDKNFEAELACPDLDIYLQDIYRDESELIAIFLCSEYESKDWCRLEWRAIRDLISSRQGKDIMLLRFDDTPIPGLFKTTDGHVSLAEARTATEVARLIIDRWEHNRGSKGKAGQ